MNDASPPVLGHLEGVATARAMLKAQSDYIRERFGSAIIGLTEDYAPAILATLLTQYVAVEARGSATPKSEVMASMLGRLRTILSGVQRDNIATEAEAEAVARKMFDDFFPGARS